MRSRAGGPRLRGDDPGEGEGARAQSLIGQQPADSFGEVGHPAARPGPSRSPRFKRCDAVGVGRLIAAARQATACRNAARQGE